MTSLRPLVFSLALMAAAPAAVAGTTTNFGFACFTNNTGSCSSFASQLSLTVEDTGASSVQFVFSNASNGKIKDFYFDTNRVPQTGPATTRLSSLTFTGPQTGVAFSIVSNPDSRPSGSSSFNWEKSDTDYMASANGSGNEVDFGEQSVLNGVLGVSYANFIASFAGPFSDSRIALHILSLGQGQNSETMFAVPSMFAASSTTVVPVPGALPLMLGGLLGLGFFARRRNA